MVSTPLLFTNYGVLDGKNAAYIFRLLSQMGEFPIIRTEGYLEEVTEDGNKIKRVTEKGRSVGIDEEERKAKFGGSYYAITHSKQSQQVIIEMLKKHYSGIKP